MSVKSIDLNIFFGQQRGKTRKRKGSLSRQRVGTTPTGYSTLPKNVNPLRNLELEMQMGLPINIFFYFIFLYK
jgi:hypothetical protein